MNPRTQISNYRYIGLGRTLFLILLTICGCAAKIVPPPEAVDSVKVAVTNYGRHSSLILPASGSGSTEYAFGDWNWFARGKNTPCDGLSALLASQQAALGRIDLPLEPDSDALPSYLKAERVLVFDSPKNRVDELRDRLDHRFRSSPAQPVYNEAMRLWFVKDDETYRAWHNCNHMTADWLRELGCGVTGATWWSNYRLARDR